MTALSIQPPYPIFTEADGSPLENGFVYIGTANLDPVANPIAVFWDAALTVAAAQPIRTLNGYPSRNGTPARLYVGSDYSIRVNDAKGVAVYSAPAATERWSNVVVTGADASEVNFLPAGAGAQSRTVQSKLRDVVSVFDFMTGAQITDVQSNAGLVDVTAAMQAAHNTGPLVHYPAGTYRFSKVSIPSGGIVGDGPGLTILRSTDNTSDDLIVFAGAFVNYGPGNPQQIGVFRDFSVTAGAGAKANGAAIAFRTATPSTTFSMGHLVDNVFTDEVPVGVHHVNHEFGKITNCRFGGYSVAGVRLENLFNSDMGDLCISGCTFVTNSVATPCRAVWQQSSGGLRFVNNKILGGQYGVSIEYAAVQATANLVIVGNSIELCFVAAIQLVRTSGTQTFKNIVIADNQIALTPAGIITDSSGFLSDLVITGNDFNLNSNATYPNTVCVSMNAVAAAVIDGNLMRGNASGTRTGVSMVNCTGVKIGTNIYEVDDPIATSNTTWSVTKEIQGANIILGTTPGTTTTGYVAYGSALHLSALQTVTWANLGLRNLKEAPDLHDVTLTPSTANGTVSGVVISVSTTGMTFYAVTNTTALAARLAVTVAGVL